MDRPSHTKYRIVKYKSNLRNNLPSQTELISLNSYFNILIKRWKNKKLAV